jgi:gas vesicle protein
MNERRYYSHEARLQAQREIALIILLTLLIGVGIGSLLALLFAPKEGEAIREDIGQEVDKRVGTIEKQVKGLRTRLEDYISGLT